MREKVRASSSHDDMIEMRSRLLTQLENVDLSVQSLREKTRQKREVRRKRERSEKVRSKRAGVSARSKQLLDTL